MLRDKILTGFLGALAMVALAASSPYAATCTATGFYKDGINLTAAMVAQPGETDLSGNTVDATGCNIGIYYGPGTSGTVDSVAVSGANYFGILVAGDCGVSAPSCATVGATSVDITNSSVHDIGESPLNGTQHGDAIAYYAFGVGASATGTVSGNAVYNYQKGGIVALGPGAGATISGNTVTGQTPVDYIAQNGIEIDYGASGQVMRNTVTGNSYIGTNGASSIGILVFGGCGYALTTGVQIVKNTIGSSTLTDGNDIGIALANYDPTCMTAPSTATNNKVINNTLVNAEIVNVSGNGSPAGYQAGILDSGVNDKLINNNISGQGYTPTNANPCSLISPGTEVCAIDTDSSTATKVHANSIP